MKPPAVPASRGMALQAAVALLLGAGPAQAHLVTTGLGPLYDGAAHFALSPADLVPVLALALLAGLRGPQAARWMLFALPPAWLAGGVAGWHAGFLPGDVLPAVSFMVAGGLVAMDAALPAPILAGLAGLVGLGQGLAYGAAMAEGDASWPALAGSAAAVFVTFALVAAVVVPFRSRLARTVVRVSGSWIAAAGVLLLGWALRRGGSLPMPG